MEINKYCVYITTNSSKNVLYTGVTNDLKRRVAEHFKNRGKPETFAGKYYSYWLVYFESYSAIDHAIKREKEIKNMSRDLKIRLIKEFNPSLLFLNRELFEGWPPK